MKLSHQVAELEAKLEAYRILFRVDKSVPIAGEFYAQPKIRNALKTLGLNRAWQPCPFPNECQEHAVCMVMRCNYDTCSNGRCYRMS